MVDIAVIPATLEHVRELAPVMRAADRAEAEAALGLSPYEGLRRSVAMSLEAWCGTADGKVVCLFGVMPVSLLAGEGCPWLIGSDLVERHAVAFLRRNRPMIAGWLELFPVLRNFVDCRHTVAIRWLRWCGFTLEDPIPYGAARLPFHPFVKRA